jgi:hypothetical protein
MPIKDDNRAAPLRSQHDWAGWAGPHSNPISQQAAPQTANWAAQRPPAGLGSPKTRWKEKHKSDMSYIH